MMTRIMTVVLTCLAATALAAQEPVLVAPDTTVAGIWRLFAPVELTRPTIIILIPVPEPLGSLVDVNNQLRAADSLRTRLADAARWGYGFAIRATRYQGIHDPGANAYYAASREQRPAVVIARPGSPPRFLRFWPRPDQLAAELQDYERVFRHLTPM